MKKKRRAWLQGLLLACFLCVAAVIPSSTVNAEIISRTLTSQLAGYYWLCDDDAGNSNYLYHLISEQEHYSESYTWTDKNASINNTNLKNMGLGFTQETSLDVTNFTGRYLHIAAVDAAGNIGPTSTIEIKRTNVFKLIFNTNHLTYQINPGSNVHPGAYASLGKETVPAQGKNTMNAYYAGYYAVDGTDVPNTGKGVYDDGTFKNFGGDFPIPNATGCTFVGWNSKPDGTGTYYSAMGDDIGDTKITDKVLKITDITGSNEYGQTMTLYAIWADGATAKKDNTVVTNPTDFNTKFTDNISATINYIPLNTTTGWTAMGTTVIDNATSQVQKSTDTATWTNKASVTNNVYFQGTGTFGISQHLYSPAGNRLASTDAVVAATNEVSSVVTKISNTTDKTIVIWNQNGDAKTTQLTPNGTTELTDTFYTGNYNHEKTLTIDYQVQGTYKVYGSGISRTHADSKPTKLGMQGYPAFMKTDSMELKIDATKPKITHYEVKQDSLDNYPADKMEEVMGKGLYTSFTATVTDYLETENGAFIDKKDSSGIQGVYINIYDPANTADTKTYRLTEHATENTTGGNVIKGNYNIALNLYTEFPNSSLLIYNIYAIDNAGNKTDEMDYVTVDGKPGYPEGDTEVNPGDHNGGTGMLKNFSVKTIIHSTEADGFNVDPENGETYFQIGDFGRVEVWTVGYTDSISFDFDDLGLETKKEIEDGRLNEMYNMGLSRAIDANFCRVIPHTLSETIKPSYFEVYDEATKAIKKITEPDPRYAKLLVNDAGVAYAQHYYVDGWTNAGTNVRISPYYKLQKDGDKKNADGTPQYKWENHIYTAIGNKNDDTTGSTNHYILWDTRANDVHYRVTHES